jgi:RHS repeat-associated protein
VCGYAETSIINIYDANGNLVTGDGRYYEYNDANQLTKVRQGDQAGPVIAEYFYDAAGQRVKKIENGVVTYYVGRHYEKQVGGANAGGTSYYFGEGGERVAKKDSAGNIFYYHLDHLDGINVVTNSTGTEVSRTDYLPFGDLRTGSSNSEKYSFTGKEKDKTSLYYFNARYNSPEIRHFTQADIAEPDYSDPQDLNRYAYVGNNPLSYVDEDGFKKKKKKAKLSKREKWMIAHGADPDKDKTSLKKAKKQYEAGTKYTTTVKAITTLTSGNSKSNLAAGTVVQTNAYTDENTNISNGRHLTSKEKQQLREYGNQMKAQAAYYNTLAKGIKTTEDRVRDWWISSTITIGTMGASTFIYGASAVPGIMDLGETLVGGAVDVWDAHEDSLISNSVSTGKGIIDDVGTAYEWLKFIPLIKKLP